MRFILAVALLTLALPAHARAQEEEHAHEGDTSAMSEIPSLTEQQIQELKTGGGMGFARLAEVNHYPGPKHVLELAEELELTDEQRETVGGIRAKMLEKAIPLGEKIIEAEGHLNMRFQHGHIDEAALREATDQIAALYGELRYTHLSAHLAAQALLTQEQIATYDQLRGYTP
jgi:Spy/CpxP family protein refolding chaperone